MQIAWPCTMILTVEQCHYLDYNYINLQDETQYTLSFTQVSQAEQHKYNLFRQKPTEQQALWKIQTTRLLSHPQLQMYPSVSLNPQPTPLPNTPQEAGWGIQIKIFVLFKCIKTRKVR